MCNVFPTPLSSKTELLMLFLEAITAFTELFPHSVLLRAAKREEPA